MRLLDVFVVQAMVVRNSGHFVCVAGASEVS
jgi:hypothetical protein